MFYNAVMKVFDDSFDDWRIPPKQGPFGVVKTARDGDYELDVVKCSDGIYSVLGERRITQL